VANVIRATALRLITALVRRSRPISFGALGSLEPVSRAFGLDRGTPIDRHYIEMFLAERSTQISGAALEVGEIRYLGRFGSQASRRCILVPTADVADRRSRADEVVVADLAALPKGLNERFDTFVCTQTLNFIFDAAAAVRGAHQLLRPGGVFIGTVAGISQVSRHDADRWGDYWRFTPQGIEGLLKANFGGSVEIVHYGNVVAAMAMLQGLALEDLPSMDILAPPDRDYPVILGFVAWKEA
jgi:SAM-dependent methyltransferase